MKRVIILGLVLFSSQLWAQTVGVSGFDINFLRPSRDGSGIILTAGSSALKWRQVGVGADFHWSEGLLAVINTTTGNRVKAVDRMIVSDLNLALGLFPHTSFAVGVPVILRGKESNLTTETGYSFSGVGDIDLDLKFSLLPDRQRSLGLGLIETVSLPTGNAQRFVGYGRVTSWSRLVIDKTVGPVTLAANAGYRFLQTKTVLAIPVENQLTYSGGLAVRLGKGWEIFGEASGYLVPSNSTAANRPLLAWGGLRKQFGKGRVHAAGGKGITTGAGSSQWTAAVGGGFTTIELKKKERKRTLVGTETIQFAFSKDEFLVRWNAPLDRIADLFLKGSQVVISAGHADNEGDETFNLDLSRRRAQKVSRYLQGRGIPADKITIEAHGEKEPVADNRTFEGKSKNRRVEVKVYR